MEKSTRLFHKNHKTQFRQVFVNCLDCVFCDLPDEYDLSFGISGGLNSRVLFGSQVSSKSTGFSDFLILILLYNCFGRNNENRFLVYATTLILNTIF